MRHEQSPARDWALAMRRGSGGRCPSCGHGRLFSGYLKVRDTCGICATELHHHQADDAPPYFTMFIVGHLVVAGVLALEQWAAPPAWLHLMIWMPLSVMLCLLWLPMVKGALIGLQWALRMHGFGDPPDSALQSNWEPDL